MSYQERINKWMLACFGPAISADKTERNYRFLEEALELVQANGCTRDEACQLVDYVYGRPQGDINQEVGGVMVTLAALCTATNVDMDQGGETELARIWTKIEQIRAKQAAKSIRSPLPGPGPGNLSYWRNRAVPVDCPHEWVTYFSNKNQRNETKCARCGYTMEAPPAEPAGFARASAARAGYDGNACTRCQNFTLRRSGTCMVCDTCGETTGCS